MTAPRTLFRFGIVYFLCFFHSSYSKYTHARTHTSTRVTAARGTASALHVCACLYCAAALPERMIVPVCASPRPTRRPCPWTAQREGKPENNNGTAVLFPGEGNTPTTLHVGVCVRERCTPSCNKAASQCSHTRTQPPASLAVQGGYWLLSLSSWLGRTVHQGNKNRNPTTKWQPRCRNKTKYTLID